VNNNYQETIDWLFRQFPAYQLVGGKAYKPGLETIYQLLAAFDNPHQDLRFIHVAGTNGKGSTCSMLASILTESGYKVGLFTSPHIQDFRERIRVNGEMADEQFVIETTAKIRSLDLPLQPSFFEISFLMALLYFKRQACDVCVIETGLGGRLDATNCITPLVAAITNISIEHTQYLGDTISAIASEKAGIIKEGIPIVIGERIEEADQVFVQKAQLLNAPIIFASDSSIEIPSNFPLLGKYQQYNFGLVSAVLTVLKDQLPISAQSIEKGLAHLTKNTGFYGRLQVMEHHPRVIFDVSHNEAGIRATLDYFKDEKSLIIVYGTSSDKNLDAIFPLFPKSARYFFTEFSNERSAKKHHLEQFSKKYDIEGEFFSNAFDALKSAKLIANKEDMILVFGSFFLISNFFEKK
jgi:dihydrofolate synthase / folylpolyglutamate synthase